MRRNPYTRQLRLTREIARQAAQTAEEAARGQSSAENSVTAGQANSASGEFQGYGLLDFTAFDTPFRLAP